MNFFTRYEYLKSGRLSDVIRLICILATDENFTFRKNEGLNITLNGKPKSAKEWFDIAKEHPEFFKFNVAGNNVVLLFRSCVKPDIEGKREPLTIDQTQKLIDQAISLHDKQIARLQKNNFLIPIITAIIASITTGFVAYFTLNSTNLSIKSLDKKLNNIELLLQNHRTPKGLKLELKPEIKIINSSKKLNDTIKKRQ